METPLEFVTSAAEAILTEADSFQMYLIMSCWISATTLFTSL